MRITFHIGAHRTDEDRLVRSLRGNAETLARHDVAVPKPKHYRKLLRDAMIALRGEPADAARQAEMLAEILGDAPQPRHLVLSNEHFLCVPDRVLDEGVLYARAFKAAWMRNLFADHDVRFAIGLRDPATFVPALFAARSQEALDFDDYLLGINPRRLSWADMIARLRHACPDSPVIVWCNEDTPLLWPEIMRAVAGLPADAELVGVTAIAEEIMRPDGAEGLRAYLEANPAKLPGELRGTVAGFLERYGDPGLMEEEIDLPGWTSDLMAALTARYEAEIGEIAALPGVTLIVP